MQLCDPIQYVPGVGPKLAGYFGRLGVASPKDLLFYYPRDYVDFTHPYRVAEAPFDTPCVVKATVWGLGTPRRVSGGKLLTKVSAGDESAALILTYFNNPYGPRSLRENEEYFFYGKFSGSLTERGIVNPTVLPAAQSVGLVPVYPQTAGLSSRTIAKCVCRVLEATADQLVDPLPAELREKYRLEGLSDALRHIHRPASKAEADAARRRLAFQELYDLQLGMLQLRGRAKAESGAHIEGGDLSAFLASLGFAPTGAQRRAIDEIARDLAAPWPMNRLLQGDVGSGKTLVAAAAMLLAAQSGFQSVLMAPTEILAQQHQKTLERFFAPLGYRVALLTGSLKGKERTAALAAIAGGEAQFIVGTHALLGDKVSFSRLGFVITDEQHRFGVRQRAALAAKAYNPHILVMSATPIPRTLGLLLYGDLDISLLDELPPGRTPVRTYTVGTALRARMYRFIERQLAAGHQAYIVCPVIEDTGSELQSVTEYYEEVAKPLLPGRRVALMHGRMKASEKAAVMEAFSRGDYDVLCSTTVIEVGVDVPNANVMVIENAERYGLSALHQLRGRVGRGAAESTCVLVSDHKGEGSQERLKFLCGTNDGFAVAQFDLENRGPGDFFGNRQHGLPHLKLADFLHDNRMLECARREAETLLSADPELRAHPVLKTEIEALFADAGGLN